MAEQDLLGQGICRVANVLDCMLKMIGRMLILFLLCLAVCCGEEGPIYRERPGGSGGDGESDTDSSTDGGGDTDGDTDTDSQGPLTCGEAFFCLLEGNGLLECAAQTDPAAFGQIVSLGLCLTLSGCLTVDPDAQMECITTMCGEELTACLTDQ